MSRAALTRWMITLALSLGASGCFDDVVELRFELMYNQESCGDVPPHHQLFDNDVRTVIHVFDIEHEQHVAERCYNVPGQPDRNLFGLPEVLNHPEARIEDLPAGALIVVELKLYNRPDGSCAPFDPANPLNSISSLSVSKRTGISNS